MREIVFDTETTGLDFEADRVVEIGGVELWNHIPTGKNFHSFVRPAGRKVDPGAFDVHGLSDEFLADKPLFAAIAEEFLAFIGSARLIAHNATFDIRFLDAEFARIGQPPIGPHRVIDTLPMARRKFPMAPATLDALCSRFNVDASRRDKHGALLDLELLAEVYIELIGGRQSTLGLLAEETAGPGGTEDANWRVLPRPAPLPPRLTADEIAGHRAFVETLGPEALWRVYLEPAALPVAAEA